MECTIPSFPRIAAETPLGEPWTGNFKLQKQEVIKTPVAVTARRSAFASLKIRRVLQEASVRCWEVLEVLWALLDGAECREAAMLVEYLGCGIGFQSCQSPTTGSESYPTLTTDSLVLLRHRLQLEVLFHLVECDARFVVHAEIELAAEQLEVGAAGAQAVAEQLIGLAEPQERGRPAQWGGGGSPLRHAVRYLFAQDRDLRR